MTTTELWVIVRDQIGDSVTPYRYADTKLLRYLNDGRRALKVLHPEAFYVSTIVTADYADIAETATVDVIEHFTNALMHFVCHRCLSEDSEDASAHALAKTHFELYSIAMGGG